MSPDMRRLVALTACFVLIGGGVAGAQEDPGNSFTLRGMVVDTSQRPVPGVLVYLASARIFSVSEETGWFSLTEIEDRTDTLQVRGRGFLPRSFVMNVPELGPDTVDVGVVLLEPGPPPTLALSATVRDTLRGRSVAGAQVLVNDSVVGETDTTGTFSATELPINWGINVVVIRRVGYAPLFSSVWVGEANTHLSMTGIMQAQAVNLPEVVVEADRIRFSFDRVGDFARRRQRGWGRFFSREDIERRDPSRVTDLLHAIPQLAVRRVGAITRVRFTTGQECEPGVWLDGARLADSDIDRVVDPQSVTGIEVYRAFEIPVEFAGSNSCGAIVIWTR